MTPIESYYLDFEYNSSELYKYIEAAGIFSIMLKNSKIVHFIPESGGDFKRWLDQHEILNIRE